MIKYSHCAGNLGDFLFTSALFRKERGILQIGCSDGSTNYANALESVCDFELLEQGTVKCGLNLSLDRQTHHAVQILNYCGLRGENPIPRIFPRQLHVERMKWKLKGISNPILFHPQTINTIATNSTTGYRDVPFHLLYPLALAIKNRGFTPIMFVSKALELDKISRVAGVEYIPTTLEEFIAGCSIVGKYIGIDCGVLHTIIATGGKVLGLVPPSHPLIFPHGNYLWKEGLWTHEPRRAEYVEFAEIPAKFLSSLDFVSKL